MAWILALRRHSIADHAAHPTPPRAEDRATMETVLVLGAAGGVGLAAIGSRGHGAR
jgi:NADPH:quinone reductase-like Zn-dependent oxidoreductase